MRDAIVRRRSFNLIHLETVVEVDVFVPRDRPFDGRARSRSSAGDAALPRPP